MRIRACALLLVLSVLFYALTALLTIEQQKSISEKMIRLHVVAQSDSESDQANKLRVRDRVLALSAEYLDGADTAEEAHSRLHDHLGQLELEAERCLEELGAAADVTVSLKREQMYTRVYDSFSLPAGEYSSLRVVIGNGDGANWWCVVFPSLCTAATMEEFEQSAIQAGLTEADIYWLTEDSKEVEIRFQLLEWLQKIKQWLR